MSATAFVPQLVPLAVNALSKRTRSPCVSPRRSCRRLIPNATMQTDASLATTREKDLEGLHPCVPEEAWEIECQFAIEMLRRLQWTKLDTNLAQSTVGTAHVVSPGDHDDAVPILFMHGFDSNCLEYRYILPLLDEEANVDAHFLDVLGWGLTEKPSVTGFSYGPDAKREHLRAYHEQVMGSKPMVLVGASVGGAIAIDFALHYPERVQALTLLAPQAFTDKPASTLMQKFPIIASLGADVLRSDWLRNQAVQLAYESEALKCRDTLRIGGLHCKSQGWKEAAIDFIKGEGYCLSDKVQDIKCPTLVLWGENDRVLPKGDSQKCLDTIHNCRLEVVKDSGHSPHIEKPSQVTRQILDFLPDSAGIK